MKGDFGDPRALAAAAATFDDQAASLRNVIGGLDGAIPSGWRGAGADTFRACWDAARTDMLATATLLDQKSELLCRLGAGQSEWEDEYWIRSEALRALGGVENLLGQLAGLLSSMLSGAVNMAGVVARDLEDVASRCAGAARHFANALPDILVSDGLTLADHGLSRFALPALASFMEEDAGLLLRAGFATASHATEFAGGVITFVEDTGHGDSPLEAAFAATLSTVLGTYAATGTLGFVTELAASLGLALTPGVGEVLLGLAVLGFISLAVSQPVNAEAEHVWTDIGRTGVVL